ncbi:N-acetylmuramoyl-L-alanine amidase [Hoyosella altamirensis]|uniref:N-acetylmuramoyl-L-alanine amidase domain-containing protein n=1 Tax=Hoyosella altamirensis TaxID=616997 RepID=A0A839RV93_9ACTN|nr:N-acetylmuramoyl-L-alanine amidase [Hoyosella altamirensis]MBB3040158.1 hypothetical protein [Hoyosella altamirensis]
MAQFKADVDLYTRAHSGLRNPNSCQFVCLHTTENADTTPPENVAQWQQNTANQSSYNILVGTNGRTVRSNDDNIIPWSAGTEGNRRGLHLSFIGRAARTRAQWLAQDAQLRAGARVVAAWCRDYGIAAAYLTAADLRAGRRGITGHAEVNQVWSSGAVRTDPGAGFPKDVFVRYVTEAIGGGSSAPVPALDDVKITTVADGRVVDVSLKQPQTGGISHFAGPTDQSTINGHMALSGEPGRAPRDHWYAAMRWNYCRWEAYQHAGETWLRPVSGTSDLRLKERLNGVKLLVTHHKSGKKVVLRAADTGPRPVKRVIDVSPHVEKTVFGGATDDQVTVELAPADTPLGPYTGPSTPPSGGTVSDKSDARLVLEQLGGPNPFDGWGQLGGRTVVNALAAIGENLGVPGMYDPANREEEK